MKACASVFVGSQRLGGTIPRKARRLRLPLSAKRPVDVPPRKAANERNTPATQRKGSSLLLPRDSPTSRDVGTVALCFANAVVYFLDHVARLNWPRNLYLFHWAPHWWQFFTSAFCHAGWEHLSSNIFLLYVFGKLVEEQEGAVSVWIAYLICALGGNLAAFWFYPKSAVSIGASAAVFGLFAVSVLIRLSWNLKKLLEVGILGQFVVKQVLQEVNMQVQGGAIVQGTQIGHIAHLGGAVMGVLLILLLRQIPVPDAT